MAEMLVKLGEARLVFDPNSWDRLMPVVVKPDGWTWGDMEVYPAFGVLRIPEMTVEELSTYCVGEITVIAGTRTTRSIRKNLIDLDSAPPQVLNEIRRTGYYTCTRAQFLAFVIVTPVP